MSSWRRPSGSPFQASVTWARRSWGETQAEAASGPNPNQDNVLRSRSRLARADSGTL